jgi:diguanylate cyclase (GGDEF)-like protein
VIDVAVSRVLRDQAAGTAMKLTSESDLATRRETDLATRRESDRQTPAIARRYGDALRCADGRKAESIALAALSPGLSGAGVHARIIAPAMQWIGGLYEQGVITIADVHVATAISHRVAAALYPSLHIRAADSRETVIVAGPEGQQHTLGLRIAADVLEGAGFRVVYLGADVPAEALAVAVDVHRPALVCLSLTPDLGTGELEEARVAVAQTSPGTPILLGGQGIGRRLLDDHFPYVPDVESLVAAAERLIESGEPGSGRAPAPSAAVPARVVQEPARASATHADQMLRATEETSDLVREQVRLTRKFRALAFEDHLCGLANRRAFDDRYAELTGGEDVQPLVVMLLDLDQFKQVNDVYGHERGDEALIAVADVLRRQLRDTDLPARFGGDEFAALIPGVDLPIARRIAERVERAVAAAWSAPQLGVSIGVAVSDRDSRRTLQAADDDLYRAKAVAHRRSRR